jgi:hypothetical protein
MVAIIIPYPMNPLPYCMHEHPNCPIMGDYDAHHYVMREALVDVPACSDHEHGF